MASAFPKVLICLLLASCHSRKSGPGTAPPPTPTTTAGGGASSSSPKKILLGTGITSVKNAPPGTGSVDLFDFLAREDVNFPKTHLTSSWLVTDLDAPEERTRLSESLKRAIGRGMAPFLTTQFLNATDPGESTPEAQAMRTRLAPSILAQIARGVNPPDGGYFEPRKTWAEYESDTAWYMEKLDRLGSLIATLSGPVYVTLETEHNLFGNLRTKGAEGFAPEIPERFGGLMIRAAQRLKNAVKGNPEVKLYVAVGFGLYHSDADAERMSPAQVVEQFDHVLQHYAPAPEIDFLSFHSGVGQWDRRRNPPNCEEYAEVTTKARNLPHLFLEAARYLKTKYGKKSASEWLFFAASRGSAWDEAGRNLYRTVRTQEETYFDAGLFAMSHFFFIDSLSMPTGATWCESERRLGLVEPERRDVPYDSASTFHVKGIGEEFALFLDPDGSWRARNRALVKQRAEKNQSYENLNGQIQALNTQRKQILDSNGGNWSDPRVADLTRQIDALKPARDEALSKKNALTLEIESQPLPHGELDFRKIGPVQ